MTDATPAYSMQLAIQYLQAGRLPEAKSVYEQILAAEPRNAEALHLLGLIAHRSGDPAAGERLIRQAIEIKPGDPDFHSNLGEILRTRKRLDEAITALRQAAALRPDRAAIHYNLGLALKEKGQLAESIDAFRESLRLNSRNPPAQHHLAAALQGRGQLNEAILAYRAAIAIQPNYPSAYNNLGNALLEAGNDHVDEAIAAFGGALALKPDFAEAQNNLGTAYWQRDRRQDAIASFRRALTLAPAMTSASINLAGALIAGGHFEEALAVATCALEFSPRVAALHRSRGLALIKLNQLDDARRAFESALQLEPDSELYRFELAAISPGESLRSMPLSYVRMIFDDYALQFDQHLVGTLEYRVPEHFLHDVLALPGESARNTREILDLGSGTGLCAMHFRPYAARIVGVDIAPQMIETARARQVYDELILADLTSVLQQRPNSFDLILAGDLFLYIGELDALFVQVARSLRSEGLFASSIENSDGQDVLLRPTRRFAHSIAYLRRLAEANGLIERSAREVIIRKDGAKKIPGWVVILQKRHPAES
ncbi:MAG TPA: tetratricopeptide repeat protein [Phycisphaerae bacterium]|nr:tetratricopeptide repeat protein [Phycisphaerae bacterium]